MYSTIHKSALSQQINKTFLFFQNCKSIPPISASELRDCNRGRTEHRRHTWAAEAQSGREDAGTLRAGKAQSRLPAKRDSLMTDKDARQTILSTEAQEGARRSWEDAEEVPTEVGGSAQAVTAGVLTPLRLSF